MSTTKKHKEFRATKRLCDDIALVIEKGGDGGLFMALSTAELEQSTAIKRLKSIPQIAAAIRDRKAVLDARKPAPQDRRSGTYLRCPTENATLRCFDDG